MGVIIYLLICNIFLKSDNIRLQDENEKLKKCDNINVFDEEVTVSRFDSNVLN